MRLWYSSVRRRQWLCVAAGVILCLSTASLAAAGPRAYVLSTGNVLYTIDAWAPATPLGQVTVTGLNAGDSLVAIDFRPQNGHLYGLGFNSGAGTVQVYHISHRTGTARPVGPSGTFVAADGTTPVPITGPSFGFDFDPEADRIRVVTSAGQNFRMDPNSGAFIDGDLGPSDGSVPGLNMDGSINGAAVQVDGAAYTNSEQNPPAPKLFTLSAASDRVYRQNLPDLGTQTVPLAISVAGVGAIDFTASNGFDIVPGPFPGREVTPADGVGYAALTVGGVSQLYAIDFVNGGATALGVIGDGTATLLGLAVHYEFGGFPSIALDATGAQLIRFKTSTPSTRRTVVVSGLEAGEALVGIDWRPNAGQLFGLGFNPANGTGSATLYRLDPQTGAATIIGLASGVADGAGNPISLAGASEFGFDFNPTVDRIRLVTNNGINFRINPNTGVPIVPPDTPLNGGGTGATGAAYTNSFGDSTVTTLFVIDAATDSLFIQNPPNNGTLTVGHVVSVKGSPIDFSTVNGFDIAPYVQATANNAPAIGQAFATLTVGGVPGFYSIDLGATATARPIETFGPFPATRGLTVGDAPPTPTTTTITSSANPSAINQAMSFFATIAPAGATGTVAFTLNGQPIVGCEAQPVAGNVATCTTSPALGGDLTIVGSFSGGPGHLPSTSASFTQTITAGAATSSTALAINPQAVPAGTTITFTAFVTPSSATGFVTFRVDGAIVAIPAVTGGQATFSTSALAVGTHEVTATYGGNSIYALSTSSPGSVSIFAATTFSQYFAEGATGFFNTEIGLLNASKTDNANVTITLFPEGTGSPHTMTASLSPLGRQSLDLRTVLGEVSGISTLITSDKPVAATRQMTWGNPVYGSTLESGIDAPSTTWYFAEGATNVFSLFFLLQNPTSSTAHVTFTHLLEGGAAPITYSVELPRESRRTFFINDMPNAPGLAGANLSTVITSNVPIVTERAMYLNTPGQPPLNAGAAGRGATALSTTWSLAEGATGFFHTYLLLGNPNGGDASATVRYQLPDGTTFDKTYAIAARSRLTVDVNGEDPRLASTAVGMSVSSTQPIVAERAMWWGDPFYEGSVAIGSTQTGTMWGIGEGMEGGPLAEATFVLVSNASTTPGTVRFIVAYDDGTHEENDYALSASARLTVRIGDDFPNAVGQKFSVLVESLTPGVLITAEVARYQSTGQLLGAGGVAAATRIQ